MTVSVSVTVLPASAVPEKVGVVSLVLPPLVTVPVTGAALSVTLPIDGADGARASTMIVAGWLVFPAMSVAVTLTIVPWGRGSSGV